MKPTVYVLAHLGLNCEKETARAWQLAGAEAKILSLFELKERPQKILQAHALAIPGGFSFGDEVAAGKLAAQFIQTHASEEWLILMQRKTPIIGICNGFQMLCELGAFNPDGPLQASPVALAENRYSVFTSEWKSIKKGPANTFWTKGIAENESFWLPVRHKSGRLVVQENWKHDIAQRVALQYEQDWNGGQFQAAALTNSNGHVFGLMPHPEGAVEDWQIPPQLQHPQVMRPMGPRFFRNAIEHIQQTWTRFLKRIKNASPTHHKKCADLCL